MNNAKVLKKWILFPILVAFVAILNIDNVTAQQAGSAQNTATIQEQSNQPRFYNGVFKADESKFNTTVYTFNDITVFSYFNDTDITITSFAGDTVFSDTLAANGFTTFNANDGIFSISSGKSYTALVGDAVSNLVQGYFAIDQSGRGTSTLLNTYMVGNFHILSRYMF